MSRLFSILFAMALVALGTVFGCRPAEGSPSPLITTATGPAPGGVADAAALYAANCAGCHGAERQGGVGPPLNPASLDHHSEAEVGDIIANGRPGTAMPPWKASLSGEQIKALAKFVKS